MKNYILKFAVTVILLSASNKALYAQELFLDDAMYVSHPIPGDGIWAEKPNYKNADKHQYTRDNISYKLNRVFVYNYYYQDPTGKKFKFLAADNTGSLNLIPCNKQSDSTIEKFVLSVTDQKEKFKECDSSCTQTTISYSYLIANTSKNKAKFNDIMPDSLNKELIAVGAVSSGLIDNKRNIWMHPPRQYTFKILQFSPFPFYQFDESINHWAWNVEIGNPYLDTRWINAQGNVVARYDYERLPNKTIKTAFGRITCHVTIATGTLHVGTTIIKTYLKSFFNPEYGFVRLEYTNINGSKMVITLSQMKA